MFEEDENFNYKHYSEYFNVRIDTSTVEKMSNIILFL